MDDITRQRPPEASPSAPPADTLSRLAPQTKGTRLAGLEGPRGLGAICVIVAHVGVHTPGISTAARLDFLGQALTFFFVLSGFLLYLPYVQRYLDGRPRPDAKRYFANRVRRIFPAYLVIFLIVNFVLRVSYLENPVVAGWDKSDNSTGMITDPIPLLAHLTLTQSLFPSTLQTGINPAWSLTAEWGFYLVLPLVGYFLFRSVRRRSATVTGALIPAAALIAVGLVANTVTGFLQRGATNLTPLEAYWGPNWIAVLSRSSLALADNFAWGMVAAVIYVAIARGAFRGTSTRTVVRVSTAAMLIALVASMIAFVLGSRYISSIFAVSSCALIVMIVAPLARGEESRLARITDWRPLKYLGMISLSAYLWHYPVLILVERWGVPIPNSPLGLLWGSAVVIGITVALATATYYLVEKPMMSWRT
ncbi:acyltransferase [Rhodococcus kroppenstedtii]|uniref:Peptidoglycan/LPS O-acetylase OafA/YrhL, contains acyltransferase and SGNH-hydrolase domains n=1 Tax=Rhodococcoides kroppenstedtii TaxID=293050 RepID=A0A1I0TMV7_9NOCA|nr:acyltransferase [Rhodococcus kroppenstedtii]MDV7198337.1 acyltransferase [Rhodococcus kroppenstedtii]SFA53102.1 Peptidoglycan/LPS O-acetylase OafA/YrhL, contains acyltransferase and SGNH-hydrolase domains [Rhodococcus kroppenstedtii]